MYGAFIGTENRYIYPIVGHGRLDIAFILGVKRLLLFQLRLECRSG